MISTAKFSAYLSELTFSEEEYYETEKRLDEINRLKAKYGKTMEEITAYREEQQKKLEKLENLRAAVPHCRSSYRKRSRNWMRPHIICPKSAETMQTARNTDYRGLRDLNFLHVALKFHLKDKSYTETEPMLWSS